MPAPLTGRPGPGYRLFRFATGRIEASAVPVAAARVWLRLEARACERRATSPARRKAARL